MIGTSKNNKIFVCDESVGVVGSWFGGRWVLGEGEKPGAVEVEEGIGVLR